MQAQMCIEVKGNTKKNTNKTKCSKKNIRNISTLCQSPQQRLLPPSQSSSQK